MLHLLEIICFSQNVTYPNIYVKWQLICVPKMRHSLNSFECQKLILYFEKFSIHEMKMERVIPIWPFLLSKNVESHFSFFYVLRKKPRIKSIRNESKRLRKNLRLGLLSKHRSFLSLKCKWIFINIWLWLWYYPVR